MAKATLGRVVLSGDDPGLLPGEETREGLGHEAGGAAVGSGPPSLDGRETPAGAVLEPITGTTWRAVMISSTIPDSRAWSALMMKARSGASATFSPGGP